MRVVLASLAIVALFVASASATPITDLFNTGVDASGTPLSDDTLGDPHFTLIVDPSASPTTRIRTSAGGFPIGPWLGDDAVSAWIGPSNNHDLSGPGGTYIYETTFTLPANVDLSTVNLTGQWAADDNSDTSDIIQLNGNTIGVGNAGFGVWTAFGAGSGFVPGLNVLDFSVVNGGGPTGVRVEMTGSYSLLAVPEPSSIILFGLGALGLLAVGRHRRE